MHATVLAAERAVLRDHVALALRIEVQGGRIVACLTLLLRRVFLVDVLTCPNCRGPRTLLAAIRDQDSIQRILRHLGLHTEPPEIAPARPPPQPRLPW